MHRHHRGVTGILGVGGHRVVSVSMDGTLRVMSTDDYEEEMCIRDAHDGPIIGIYECGERNEFATTSLDVSEVRIWCALTMTVKYKLEHVHHGEVTCMLWRPKLERPKGMRNGLYWQNDILFLAEPSTEDDEGVVTHDPVLSLLPGGTETALVLLSTPGGQSFVKRRNQWQRHQREKVRMLELEKEAELKRQEYARKMTEKMEKQLGQMDGQVMTGEMILEPPSTLSTDMKDPNPNPNANANANPNANANASPSAAASGRGGVRGQGQGPTRRGAAGMSTRDRPKYRQSEAALIKRMMGSHRQRITVEGYQVRLGLGLGLGLGLEFAREERGGVTGGWGECGGGEGNGVK